MSKANYRKKKTVDSTVFWRRC